MREQEAVITMGREVAMADPKMAEAPSGGRKTLVEEGTEFTGDLTSKCHVVVSGKVDGKLSAPSLTVSTSGAVHGKVKVADIRSEGELSGEFEAENVALSGRVNNNTVIRSKSLEVKLAPEKGKPLVTFGDCVLEVGDEPVRSGAGGAQGAPQAQPPQANPKPSGDKPKG
jgi:cytoskeletal protein CcmA (bactofilin family)